MPYTLADAHPFDELTEPVRAAVEQVVEAAVGSAWSFFVRSAGQGLDWDDIHGCDTQAAYRARLAAEPGLLLETCQALLEYGTGLTEQERADCLQVVAIADALALRGPPGPVATPVALASPVAVPRSEPAPVDVAPAAEPAPVPVRPGRAGRWLAGTLLAVGTAAALAWLWNQPSAPTAPRTLPTATNATAAPLAPPAVASSPAAMPAPPANPAPRPTPSAIATGSAPRPSATPKVARSAEPAPVPRVTVPAPIASPAPSPTVAPAPAATPG